jgi:hypothetical protein
VILLPHIQLKLLLLIFQIVLLFFSLKNNTTRSVYYFRSLYLSVEVVASYSYQLVLNLIIFAFFVILFFIIPISTLFANFCISSNIISFTLNSLKEYN